MKFSAIIFVACIAAASAVLPDLIELAKQNNCSTTVSLIQQAGLTDALKSQSKNFVSFIGLIDIKCL